MRGHLSDAELFARLVGFDSVSRNSNLPIADFIADYFDDPGFEIVRNPNEDGSKVNLVIRHRGTDGAVNGVGLTLCGHMDVVPADEPQWRSDPFRLTEADGAYVARGACDMKGAVALMMNVLRHAPQWHPAHPLAILLTFDEEPGTLGAQHFVGTWKNPFSLPRSVIVGEPTSLRAVRLHKGHLKMRITTHGRSAHSGYPHLGVNAIEPMGRIITALSELRQSLAKIHHEMGGFFPEAPYVALNLGLLSAGVAVNIIPDRCVLDLGVRLLPGMSSTELIHTIGEIVSGLSEAGSPTIDVQHETPPLLTQETAPLHLLLCSLVGQTRSWGVSYASDAGPLQQLGLECVLFGPGTIEVAHKPNESLPVEEFQMAGKLYERAARAMCGSDAHA